MFLFFKMDKVELRACLKSPVKDDLIVAQRFIALENRHQSCLSPEGKSFYLNKEKGVWSKIIEPVPVPLSAIA